MNYFCCGYEWKEESLCLELSQLLLPPKPVPPPPETGRKARSGFRLFPIRSQQTVSLAMSILKEVEERDGAEVGQEEQNGGLYEEEPSSKQHRRPERTLRYTHIYWTRYRRAAGEGPLVLCCCVRS